MDVGRLGTRSCASTSVRPCRGQLQEAVELSLDNVQDAYNNERAQWDATIRNQTEEVGALKSQLIRPYLLPEVLRCDMKELEPRPADSLFTGLAGMGYGGKVSISVTLKISNQHRVTSQVERLVIVIDPGTFAKSFEAFPGWKLIFHHPIEFGHPFTSDVVFTIENSTVRSLTKSPYVIQITDGCDQVTATAPALLY